MPLFAVCDLVMETDVPFPELSFAEGLRADLRFALEGPPAPAPETGAWLDRWETPSGTPWLQVASLPDAYLLRFPDYAVFRIRRSGEDVRCYAVPGTPPETIRHLFLDQVMPLLLSQRGALVLHAGAVSGPDGAIVFAGMSGSGKSTLTASFCDQGFSLLTDDCCLLRERDGRFFVVPSYPGLRLWNDSLSGLAWEEPSLLPVTHYSLKKRVGLEGGRLTVSRDRVPLARLYLVGPPGEHPESVALSIAPLRPHEALIELVRCAYCLDLDDREGIRRQFESLSRLATGARIHRLRFPHDYAKLADVRAAILRTGSSA